MATKSTYTYIKLSGSAADRRKQARAIQRQAPDAQRGMMTGEKTKRFKETKTGAVYRGSLVRFK